MNNLSPLLRGRSAKILWLGWAAILLPALGWTAVQTMRIDALDSAAAMRFGGAGAAIALGLSLVMVGVMIIPALLHLRKTIAPQLRDYIRVPCICVGVVATILALGMVALGMAQGDATPPIHGFISVWTTAAAALVVPVLLVVLLYWFFIIRSTGGVVAVTAFSVLFILWNVFCFIVTQSVATPVLQEKIMPLAATPLML